MLLSSMTFQPVADTFIDSGNLTGSNATTNRLPVKVDGYVPVFNGSLPSDGRVRTTFFKFDLSTLTPGTTITSATLRLVAASDLTGAAYKYDVFGFDDTAWTDAATWSAPPAFSIQNDVVLDSQIVHNDPPPSLTYPLTPEYYHAYVWNVKSWVTAKEGGLMSLALSQKLGVDNYGRSHFFSMEAGSVDPTYVPVLTITTAANAPDSLDAPTRVVATPVARNQIELNWDGTPGAATYKVMRGTVSGGPYTVVQTTDRASFVDTKTLNPSTDYYYVVQAVNGAVTSANSDEATATTLNILAGWTGREIGPVATQDTALATSQKEVAGSVDYTSGVWTVKGGGSDLQNGGSWCYFASQPKDATTDMVTITAQVTAITMDIDADPPDAWPKAGLMWAEDFGLNSRYAYMLISEGNGTGLQWHTSNANRNDTSYTNTPGSAPYWLRLTRKGNLFVGEYSPDNLNWTVSGTTTIPMAAQGYVGMAVTAHNRSSLNSSTFENVSFAPIAKLSAPILSVSLGASTINLNWTAQPLASTYALQRSTTEDFSTGVTTIDVPVSATSYSDTPPDASVTYYYRVTAKGSGATADSDPSNAWGVNLAQGRIIGPGVIGQYFSNLFSDRAPTATRPEVNIDYPAESAYFPAPGTPTDNYSAVWTGKIIAPVDGEYTFISNTDNFGFLWVNGQLVSFDPGDHGMRDADLSDTGGGIFPITLEAAKEYNFVFVQADLGSASGAIMKWIVPETTDRVVIPQANLNTEIGTPTPPAITLTNNPATGNPGYVGFSMTDDAVDEARYVLERATNAAFTDARMVAAMSPAVGLYLTDYSNTFSDMTPLLPSTKYYYRVTSANPYVAAYSNVITVTTPASVSFTGDGLTVHYFNGRVQRDPEFSLPWMQKVELDPDVNHAWGDPGNPGAPIGDNDFSARWTGKIKINPGEEGDYTIRVFTDDGARLWIDGASIVDSWVIQAPTSHAATMNLSVGEHDIMAEYFEEGGGATFQLFWTPPGGAEVLIPTTSLIPAAAAPAKPSAGTSQATTKQVKLNWTDNAINEVQYVVTRSLSASFTNPVVLGTFPMNYASGVPMTVTDTTVAKNTKYWYRVVAQNYDGASAPLEIIVTTPLVDVIPAAPSGVYAASGSFNGTVTVGVTWNDNSLEEDKFVIQRGTAPDVFDKTFEAPADQTYYLDNDAALVSGTTYYYQVRAENLTGPSAWVPDPALGVVASNQPLAPANGTGMVGRYFNNMSMSGNPAILRLDPVINLNFDIVGPTGRPEGWNADAISTEWKGYVVPRSTGFYTFGTTSDDGSRVYLNNNFTTPNVNAWRDQGPTFTAGTPVFLAAGKQYPIDVQFYENGGGASMVLQWTTDGMGGYQVIPTSQLMRGDFTVKPSAPTNLKIRSVHGLKIQLSWGSAADNVDSVVLMRSVDGGAFAEYKVLDWTALGFLDTDLVGGKTYAYNVVNRNAIGDSLPSNTVSALALADNLPAPWLHGDIGTPGDPSIIGDASYAGGVFTLTGGGSDIWDWSDHFQFVYQPLRTDGMITAHVLTQGTTGWSAFAGVMIRNDLTATSPHIFLAMTPGYNVTVQQRWEADGNTRGTLDNLSPPPEIPIWLRLERKGNTILAYRSDDDGSTFVPLLDNNSAEIAVNLPLDTEVYIGLITDSWDNSTICTNTFDHVSVVQGNATGTPIAASNLTAAPGEGPKLITLTWTDNSNNETGFTILRSTSASTGFVAVGQVGSNMTFFTDKQRTANTTYYYRVQANNSRAGNPNAAVSNTASSKPSTTGPVPLNYVNFADTTGLTLNSATNVTPVDDGNGNTVLQLTDAVNDQMGAVFSDAVYDISGFTANFDFQILAGTGNADGFAFVIQNIGVDALGGIGGAMGYENIGQKSAAIKFDFYPGLNTTGLYQFGDGVGETARALDVGAAGIALTSNAIYHVELLYDGSTLRQTITTPSNPAIKWTHDYKNVNLPAVMLGTTAYIGFTGATGDANARQWLNSFSFDNTKTPTIAPPIADWIIDLTDSADTVSLKLDGANVKLLKADGSTLDQRAISAITGIVLNAKLGDDVIDVITLDFTGGLIPVPLTINGDAGSDTLKLKGVDLTGLDVSVGNTALSAGGVTIAVSSIQTVAPDLGASNTLSLKSLTIGDQTSLDVAKGALILSKTGGTTAAQVFDMLASGRNGGDWNGTGLVSSTAAARFLTDGFTGLTQAEDAGGNVVVKYSWNGDVNQDALVNADDYFYVDSGYITKDPGYANGDLNFDGLVNADDYFLIDSAYIGQSSGLSADQDVLAIAQPQKKDAAPSVLSQLFSTEPVL
ncbi:MAG: PA14 domain-containing protein [Planctomycetota bacterium]|nr:PA14 domain-containing protein [Planctomycetota bacterium]